MEKFVTLKGVGAPLDMANVDTDAIIPKQFLTTVSRQGLAKGLFYDLRYDEQGRPIEGFILDQPAYLEAKILIVGDNFGCGSSREHAPWALLDRGIRCIIGESFADIFYNNCFKNGILPVSLSRQDIDVLLDWVSGNDPTITVDLESQMVSLSDLTFAFDLDPFLKKCLIEGLDDISMTLGRSAAIDRFEVEDRQHRSWLWT